MGGGEHPIVPFYITQNLSWWKEKSKRDRVEHGSWKFRLAYECYPLPLAASWQF